MPYRKLPTKKPPTAEKAAAVKTAKTATETTATATPATAATATTTTKPRGKRGRKRKPIEVTGATIRADEVMTPSEFRQRLGICLDTYTTMRRRGLEVRKLSKKHVYIDGEDWLKFVRGLPVSMLASADKPAPVEAPPDNVTE